MKWMEHRRARPGGPARTGGPPHFSWLASGAGAFGTAGFAWIDVAALASALRPRYVGEGFLEWDIVGVDAVANAEVELRAGKDAADSSRTLHR